MSKHANWVLAISLALGAAACAPVVTSQTVVVAGVGPVEVERIRVEVAAVDPGMRLVTVRQGRFAWPLYVPETFGTLQNLQVGDNLEIHRAEGAMLSARRARKGARPGIVYAEAVDTPVFASIPERFVARTLTITARFERFDPATNIVDYVGPAGPRSLTVADPVIRQDLTRLRRGDMVDLTFAEAIFIQKYQP